LAPWEVSVTWPGGVVTSARGEAALESFIVVEGVSRMVHERWPAVVQIQCFSFDF
jgi:hypothetical protein